MRGALPEHLVVANILLVIPEPSLTEAGSFRQTGARDLIALSLAFQSPKQSKGKMKMVNILLTTAVQREKRSGIGRVWGRVVGR